MLESALNLLEFDKVVDAVVSYALTPLGVSKLRQLHPLTDQGVIKAELANTTEGVRFLAENGNLQLEAPNDFDQILVKLAIETQPLASTQLVGLAAFLESIEQVCKAVPAASGGPYPALSTVINGCAAWGRECGEVRKKVDASGELVDEASPELKTIRGRLRKQRNRLRGNLESYLRGRETAKYLQERVVTERNGRFVLVIRAEHRTAIPGIVHGSSTSGASLFLEPLSTVDINNEIVALEEKEKDEVRRVLLLLSSMFRRRASDFRQTLLIATEVDAIQARAAFARATDGHEPQVAADHSLELRAARHPLLIKAVTDRLGRPAPEDSPIEPVPIDITMSPPTRALIVTGPNTGGKTVALKTAGLLVVMAQAGLHIPAGPKSCVPVFRSVFADIGDEQSIAANLSTFSGHIANIVAMNRQLALPALVLLDEVGAGTDPVEGGALGRAVVEHFRKRGAHIIATTHDDALKAYGATTDGVICAAFGFDPDTFAPTFHLVYGSTGQSLALEIAGRLGLDSSVIEAATELRTTREAQLADHLAQLEVDRRQLNNWKDDLERRQTDLAKRATGLAARETELQQREQRGHKGFEESLDTRLRTAREEIDGIVTTLRARAASLERKAGNRATVQEHPLSTGDHGTLRAEAHAALKKVARRFQESTAEPPATTGRASQPKIGVGSWVKVTTLGVEGAVRSLHGTDAEVDVGTKRLRVPLDSLKPAAQQRPAPDTHANVEIHVEVPTNSLDELNLIGCRVDEALSRVEKHLDQALMSEQRTVRFIHGHGTGQLRQAIGGFLDTHPLVKRVAPAPPEEGGSGVTIAELKE